MHKHFTMLARYNAWANRLLYDAAAALPDAQYREDRGVFFKSVHGTLNHLLVVDRIWMRRFTGTGDAPARVDAILFDALDELRLARDAEDARITAYVDGLDAGELADTIRYQPISTPDPVEQALWLALAHVFNHQTHHRGQVHGVLTALAGQAPALDLAFYQRLAAAGKAVTGL
jgi:uncharacterized damage-inducible protein DinB